jgi:hypothetical protein
VDKAANDRQAQQLSFGFPQHQNFPSWLTMTRLFTVTSYVMTCLAESPSWFLSLYICINIFNPSHSSSSFSFLKYSSHIFTNSIGYLKRCRLHDISLPLWLRPRQLFLLSTSMAPSLRPATHLFTAMEISSSRLSLRDHLATPRRLLICNLSRLRLIASHHDTNSSPLHQAGYSPSE